MEYEFMPANGTGEMENEFFPAVGKAVRLRVQCKATGLSGQELKLCRAKMLTVCGRKPVCPPFINRKKCKEKQDAWFKCTQNVFVDYEKQVKAGQADIGIGTGAGDTGAGAGDGSAPTGGGNGGKVGGELPSWVVPTAIGVGALLLVIGGMYLMKRAKVKGVGAGQPQAVATK